MARQEPHLQVVFVYHSNLDVATAMPLRSPTSTSPALPSASGDTAQ